MIYSEMCKRLLSPKGSAQNRANLYAKPFSCPQR